jgi:hypothetical protein
LKSVGFTPRKIVLRRFGNKFFWQLLSFIPKSTGAHTERAEAMAPVIQTEDAESLNQPFGSGEAKRDSKF